MLEIEYIISTEDPLAKVTSDAFEDEYTLCLLI
jgi:hypothetical protein